MLLTRVFYSSISDQYLSTVFSCRCHEFNESLLVITKHIKKRLFVRDGLQGIFRHYSHENKCTEKVSLVFKITDIVSFSSSIC